MACYGIHLHLGAEVKQVSLLPRIGPRFNPEYDGNLAQELLESESGVVYVVKRARWVEIRQYLDAQGYRAQHLGTPFQRRVLFEVSPASPPAH